jgi:putative ABC transport system substrate-binding protein
MNKNKKIKSGKIMLATFLIIACLFLSSCAEKAQEQKVYRVGIVSGADTFASIGEGFKAGMTELGYIEGENIVYDFQKLNNDPEGEKRVVKKFVEDKVDMIFSFPTEPSLAAKAATHGTDIPVVFALAGIEGNDLVQSVAKPGDHITGVRFPGPDNTLKRLDILRELVPQVKRVYLIYDKNYPNAPSTLEKLRPVASSLGITLVEDPVNNSEELKAALQKGAELDDIGIDAILVMPDILDHSPEGFGAILEFANEHKVPLGGGMEFTADLGAIFSFNPENFEMGTLAATLADKIFKGTPAGEIMVVTPPSHLRINYKVAQELGIEVPEGLLASADEIIR